MVGDLPEKKRVGDVSVPFTAGTRRTREEAGHAASFVLDSSADFLDLAKVMSISKHGFVEEDAP